jgi:hypothetical protein
MLDTAFDERSGTLDLDLSVQPYSLSEVRSISV